MNLPDFPAPSSFQIGWAPSMTGTPSSYSGPVTCETLARGSGHLIMFPDQWGLGSGVAAGAERVWATFLKPQRKADRLN